MDLIHLLQQNISIKLHNIYILKPFFYNWVKAMQPADLMLSTLVLLMAAIVTTKVKMHRFRLVCSFPGCVYATIKYQAPS